MSGRTNRAGTDRPARQDGTAAARGGARASAERLETPQATARGLVLRPESEADIPFTRQLYAATRKAELAPLPWTEEVKAAFLAKQHDAQRHHYRTHYPDALWMIVEQGGRPVGRLYLERWPSQHRVIDIALMPPARSKGFGTALLQDVAADAFASGRAVSIHVEKTNPAKVFYRRLGFEKSEDKGVYDLMLLRPTGTSRIS